MLVQIAFIHSLMCQKMTGDDPCPYPVPCLTLASWSYLLWEMSLLPSSSVISLFSRRLFRTGSTLRSAFSMPSSNSTRPRTAARTAAYTDSTHYSACTHSKHVLCTHVLSIHIFSLHMQYACTQHTHTARTYLA